MVRRLLVAACVASLLVACAAFSGADEADPPASVRTEDAGGLPDGAAPIPDSGAVEVQPVMVSPVASGQLGATSLVITPEGPAWGVVSGGGGFVRRATAAGTADLFSYGGGLPSRLVYGQEGLLWSDPGPEKGIRRYTPGFVGPLYDSAVEAFAPITGGYLAVREVPLSESPNGGFDARLLIRSQGSFSVYGHGPYAARLWDVVADGEAALVTRDDGTILRFTPSKPSDAPTKDTELEPGCRNLAANDQGVYWTRFGDGLVRMRDRSALVRTIAADQVTPFGLAADASGVYWLTGDGALRRWTGTQVVTLATKLALPSADAASRFHPLALTPEGVVLLTASEVVMVRTTP